MVQLGLRKKAQLAGITVVPLCTRYGNEETQWTHGIMGWGASGNSASGGTEAFVIGNGVYKSTDNGETWNRLLNSNTTPLEQF
jgi:hypothetical protein